jgi:hypothetical protein
MKFKEQKAYNWTKPGKDVYLSRIFTAFRNVGFQGSSSSEMV